MLNLKLQRNKILITILLFGMGIFNLNIGVTNAYFSHTESLTGNTFSTGFLNFTLTNNNLDKLIGPEARGEISHASVVMGEGGSLPMQYTLSNTILNNDSDLCSKLTVEAKLNGVSKYTGALSGLASSVTTEFGTWEFLFDMPPNVSVPNGAQCNENALFSAWRADIVNQIDSSWHDEETLSISFTARMVVLNEIYARPDGGVAPQDREYIELYNNGDTPVDTLGWQISEIAGTTETFYPVVASGAVSGEMMPYDGASTIIPAGGFLVLEFGGSASHLNDTGDTVKLYDGATILLDSHVYPGVAAGKAVVRFPDGIGFWVDPEPTPGTENMVSLEDLRMAGFDEAMIAQVLELAALKNITLLSDEVVEEVIPEVPVVPEILPPVEEEEIIVPPPSDDPIVPDSEPISEPTPEPVIDPEIILEPPEEESVIIEPEPVINETEIIIKPEQTVESIAEPELVIPEPDLMSPPQAEPALASEEEIL
jgi:hypothetical protein